MKFVSIILLLASLAASPQAGKVTWGDDGSPSIDGTSGQGCTQSGFETEDKNETKEESCK